MTTSPFDRRPVPQRTAHLICHNRRTAPQTYIVGQDANGVGGMQIRAMEGEHLFLPENTARKLYEQTGKTVFEFVGWEDAPSSEHLSGMTSSGKPAKTIDQIFAEQQAQNPEVAERLARLNAASSPDDLAFVPTNQPSIQPSLVNPPPKIDIVQARGNLSSLPMPSSEDFAEAIAQQGPGEPVDPPFQEQLKDGLESLYSRDRRVVTDPVIQQAQDTETDRIARVIAKLKQRNA